MVNCWKDNYKNHITIKQLNNINVLPAKSHIYIEGKILALTSNLSL